MPGTVPDVRNTAEGKRDTGPACTELAVSWEDKGETRKSRRHHVSRVDRRYKRAVLSHSRTRDGPVTLKPGHEGGEVAGQVAISRKAFGAREQPGQRL